MTEALKPSEVLSCAADLIEPEGAWMQGAFAANGAGVTTQEDPSVADNWVCLCLFGAVNVASGNVPDADDPRLDVEPFIKAAIGLPKSAIASRVAAWNDAPERTQAEVVAALRKASELAKAEGQ